MATRTAARALPVLPTRPAPRGDLTRVPLLGRFLRWKHARTAVQLPLLLLAAVIVADGFFGPRAGPQNAAGVGPWIQWRGFVVLALLLVGNLFCMACPFMLPRRLAKKLLPADRTWPRGSAPQVARPRAAGPAFFWGYEAFDLWDSPWLTAWLVVAYFAAAFVIDGFFKGAAFCKNVCPIGSFNFVNSLASPGEVRVRDAAVCESCETKDCIKGRTTRMGAWSNPGASCGSSSRGRWATWIARSASTACRPVPMTTWAWWPGSRAPSWCETAGARASGSLSERPDLLALALVLVFAAFVNAAGMIGPSHDLQAAIGGAVGGGSYVVGWTLFMVLTLGVVPALLLAGTTALSRRLGGARSLAAGCSCAWATAWSRSASPCGSPITASTSWPAA
jgi:hypothetical protein